MGISGLLPLLKDIQTNKKLSEFRGQTLAVDGYVWLHRGSYGCAPELTTGKPTTKYVDYAMHRVRLLRHHGINPYLVFDGGPLPAKQGTEAERKQRRDENLARANALAAQGKHSQAREYYVKCVDVTPQMAYQLIKALRAEGVPYVVAPYEADAQLAYLERIGAVDGIITEDSDLLVFGCKNVLFKLDHAASTVTCIARKDFAAIASTAAGGLSLVGWSDAQFRTMAILSGCDYLPSIPGIGLKTAWTLLRKHKTVENTLSALRLEGKKKIPHGYLDAFRLAEKVFLHQRVYDPAQGCLVHLTPLPGDAPWGPEEEAYVGAHIEPSLAKQVAEGDACPISLLPMEDINPSFVPRALKAIPMNITAAHRPDKGKGRAKDPAPAAGKHGASAAGPLHKFFVSAPAPAPQQVREVTAGATSRPGTTTNGGGHAPVGSIGSSANAFTSASGSTGAARPASAGAAAMVVGKQSGKRTLAEVMQHDMAAKRKRRDDDSLAGAAAPPPMRTPTTSKFFGAQQRSVSDPRGARGQWALAAASASVSSAAGAGPSGLSHHGKTLEKENVPCMDDEEDVLMADADAVTQEDGYESPSPSLAQWDSPDISSPVRPKASEWDDDFDADDILSSPPLARHQQPSRSVGSVVTVERAITRALPLVPLRAPLFGGRTTKSAGSTSRSHSNSTSFGKQDGRGRSAAAREPDLRDAFDDWDEEVTSGGEDFAECEEPGSTASSTPGPVTPADADNDDGSYEDEWRYAHGGAVRVMGGVGVGGEDVRARQAREAAAAAEGSSEELEEDDELREEVGAGGARDANARVAHGWWEKWARSHGGPGGSRGQGGGGGVRGNGVGGGGGGSGGSGGSDRKQTPLRRRETTMTPDGRQRPLGRAVVRSAPQVAKRASLPSFDGEELRAVGRTRLTFTPDHLATPKTKVKPKTAVARPGSADGTAARKRLEHFRWTPACR